MNVFAAIRLKSRKNFIIEEEEPESLLDNLVSKLPPQDAWDGEFFLGILVLGYVQRNPHGCVPFGKGNTPKPDILLRRAWQKRRLILTKGFLPERIVAQCFYFLNQDPFHVHFSDTMFFAQFEDDLVIDKIPLAEVKAVRDMRHVEQENTEKSTIHNALLIETEHDGYNSGRTYYLQAESPKSCQDIIALLTKQSTTARERAHAQTVFTHAQLQARKVFRSTPFQNLFAFLIIAVRATDFPLAERRRRAPAQCAAPAAPPAQNFVVCVLDAQYRTDALPGFNALVASVNHVFTAIFALELLVNLFAHWPRDFLGSGWNWLDSFIVVMSLADFGPSSTGIPDWLVRSMRAIRVVRLFGRVEELTKMFSAIAASLFPMMNAFVILIIVVSICATPESPRPGLPPSLPPPTVSS